MEAVYFSETQVRTYESTRH